jgi:diguanylate cyclase (GGDEF)-like protein
MAVWSPVLAATDTLAATDPLTGLAGRGALAGQLELEVRRARREAGCLSVLMCDVDGVQQVNDAHGRRAGDAVLSGVAAGLRAVVPRSGLAGRWGADEFLVICPGVNDEGARHLARRLAWAVRQPLRAGGSVPQPSISVGWSSAGSEANADSLLNAAHADLDAAKARSAGAFWDTG